MLDEDDVCAYNPYRLRTHNNLLAETARI